MGRNWWLVEASWLMGCMRWGDDLADEVMKRGGGGVMMSYICSNWADGTQSDNYLGSNSLHKS